MSPLDSVQEAVTTPDTDQKQLRGESPMQFQNRSCPACNQRCVFSISARFQSSSFDLGWGDMTFELLFPFNQIADHVVKVKAMIEKARCG